MENKLVWFPAFQDNLPSMTGKRIAITGTTSGTGFIAAETLARKGAEVILLNRESARATDAEAKLRLAVPTGVFVAIPCDLQDFASVRGVKAIFEKRYGAGASLDVLACNAGVMAHPDKRTKDGFDVQMQTNHLSHFLLVKQFLPALKVAAKEKGEARVVNHSSGARHGKALEAKYLQKSGEGNLGGDAVGACFDRYQQTKLANIAFTFGLEAKLAAVGLGSIKPVTCVPGLAATSLVNNLEAGGTNFGCIMTAIFNCVSSQLRQSAEDGTMPLLASIAGLDVQSGDLYSPSLGPGKETYGPVKANRRPLPAAENVCVDPAGHALLWAESEKAINESFEISA